MTHMKAVRTFSLPILRLRRAVNEYAPSFLKHRRLQTTSTRSGRSHLGLANGAAFPSLIAKHTLSKSYVLVFLAFALLTSRAQVQTPTVSVGDATITLPTPKGYYRIDGKDSKVDSVLRATMTEDVSLIAWYGSEAALAEALSGRAPSFEGANFQVIAGKRLQRITLTPEQFKNIKACGRRRETGGKPPV